MMNIKSLLSFVLMLVPALVSGHAAAQAPFPTKPIRLVIGSLPGGGNDIVGRILAAKMSEHLGQQVIVDNRGGANGIIGMESVARAAPDGYTFFQGTTGHLAVNPSMYAKLPFNIDKDFVPLTETVSLPFLLYMHPSVPVKTMGEFIAYAKSNPGKLTWSSSGNGGLPHLTGELLKIATGINTRRIPYKGSSPAFTDLIAGQVQYCIEAVPIGLQQVKAGKLVALATTSRARLPFLPDVPALSETLPKFEVLNWYGMMLPGGTPAAMANRLHAEIVRAMKLPEISAKLVAQGTDPVGSTPKEFAAFRKAEEVKWGRVVKEANIQPE